MGWDGHRADTIDKWASDGVVFVRGPVGGQFGGLESDRPKRVVRGIGFILLTRNDLRVTRSTPSASWKLTFNQIKGVTLRQQFLGKQAKESPFIVVRFVKGGKKDKLAFLVNEWEAWAKQLAQAANVSLRDERT